MKIYHFILLSTIFLAVHAINSYHDRQKRYLIFTPETQWGVFATITVPLHPETLVSVAWFFEASYYSVDNATWFEPLLGDIQTLRSEDKRSIQVPPELVSRRSFYTFIEAMLEKHEYPGRTCLLRAICENASTHFLHNGVLGDLLHLILTPSASMSEDNLEDFYYEAEYLGLENQCDNYVSDCPDSLLDLISINAENFK